MGSRGAATLVISAAPDAPPGDQTTFEGPTVAGRYGRRITSVEYAEGGVSGERSSPLAELGVVESAGGVSTSCGGECGCVTGGIGASELRKAPEESAESLVTTFGRVGIGGYNDGGDGGRPVALRDTLFDRARVEPPPMRIQLLVGDTGLGAGSAAAVLPRTGVAGATDMGASLTLTCTSTAFFRSSSPASGLFGTQCKA
jgi:hypothetical protein